MKGKKLRSFKLKVQRFLSKEGIKLLIYAVLAVLTFVLIKSNKDEKLFDTATFVSFLTAAGIVVVAELVSRLVGNTIEDGLKLSEDLDSIMETYSREKFFRINNSGVSSRNKKGEPENDIYVPVVLEGILKPNATIDTKDSEINKINKEVGNDKMYKLDSYIESNYDELFSAHLTSVTQKNKLLLRVKSWKYDLKTNTCVINFGMTTTFRSLVTNRAMDYRLGGGVSIRARYEPGPFITPLDESELSNNFGGEGFIITSDNWIPLRENNAWTIVGKRAIQTPLPFKAFADELIDQNNRIGDTWDIDTTLKKSTLFCIFKSRMSRPERKGKSQKEYADAVADFNQYKKDKREKGAKAIPGFVDRNMNDIHLIGIFRDLVEGGKPEGIVLARTPLSRSELEKEIKKSNTRKVEKDFKKRFRKLLWVYAGTREELEKQIGAKAARKYDTLTELYIDDNALILNGHKYPLFLHSAVGLEILRRYMAGDYSESESTNRDQ